MGSMYSSSGGSNSPEHGLNKPWHEEQQEAVAGMMKAGRNSRQKLRDKMAKVRVWKRQEREETLLSGCIGKWLIMAGSAKKSQAAIRRGMLVWVGASLARGLQIWRVAAREVIALSRLVSWL